MSSNSTDKPQNSVKVLFRSILENIDFPVVIKTATLPGDSGESLFVATLTGKVWIARNKKKCVFFNLEQYVLQSQSLNECGLLGFEFHPKFSSNGKFYLHYSSSILPEDYDHTDLVEEWQLRQRKISKLSVLLKIRQPFPGNNGYNTLNWEPKLNCLILTLGDGGSKYDINNYAQDNDMLFGKMIAINVEKEWCGCVGEQPALSKFSEMASCHRSKFKILAKGIQNPSSLDFHPNGLKYLIDGFRFFTEEDQSNVNEINAFYDYRVNFGWRAFEGLTPTFKRSENLYLMLYPSEVQKLTATYRPFVVAYSHEFRKDKSGELLPSSISLTGGRIYLGKEISELTSTFIFSEWKSDQDQGLLFSTCADPSYPEGVCYYKLIEIVNRPDKAKYFTTLGTDTEKQFLFLGTNANNEVSGNGTVYEILPY